MFVYFCEECRQNMDWPKSLQIFRNNCVLCGELGPSYSGTPSELPLPDERKLQVIEQADLPKEWSDSMRFSAAIQEEINEDQERIGKKVEKARQLTRYIRLLNKIYYS